MSCTTDARVRRPLECTELFNTLCMLGAGIQGWDRYFALIDECEYFGSTFAMPLEFPVEIG